MNKIAIRAVACALAMTAMSATRASAETKMDAGKGSFESKCAMCHNIDPSAGNSVGPNLHGVVGRPIGTAAGFNYSPAVAKLGGQWTVDRLVAFLQNPQAYAPGTAMPFAGIKAEGDRKAIVCFLGGDPNAPACK